MTKYKLTPTTDGSIIKKDDSNNFIMSIPPVSDNIDYQEYLEWAKTNTPEAAD